MISFQTDTNERADRPAEGPGPMLQIIESCERGGAEKHTRLITKAFCKLGYPVIIMYSPGPYAQYFKSLSQAGVECIEYPMRKSLIKTILFIRRLVRKRKIRYIHSHQHWADFYATCATLGMKKVVRFSTIHFLPGDIPPLLARCRAVCMSIVAYHTMARVFAVSTEVARKARKALLLPDKRVAVTLNSIDFEEMEADEEAADRLRQKIRPESDAVVVLCIGFLHDRKGQRYAIEALASLRKKFPGIRLVLLGEGDMEGELRRLAEKLQLEDKVLFQGYLPHVAEWMSIADVYVQPSFIDPLPRALLEAMYMGLPVVASRLGTIGEVVKDGETGKLAEPGNAQSLAETIEFYLSNRAEAERIGRNAQAFVRANCSMQAMAQKIIKCLE
jgi:glycosyltransferase involved in cell wall biosynthesis